METEKHGWSDPDICDRTAEKMMAENSAPAEPPAKFWSAAPRIRSYRTRDYENIWSEREHSSSVHELLYIVDGKSTLVIADKLKFPSSAGDFLLIPALTPHRDVFDPSHGLRIKMFSFEWEAGEEYFSVVTNRALHALDFASRTEAMRQLNYLCEHWEQTPAGKLYADVQLHALLLLFYQAVMRSQHPDRERRTEGSRADMVRQIKFFITQNYASPVSLESVSERFNISSTYISRLFHREYGVGFSEYLTSVRLEAAVTLLCDTPLQVAEVAQRCGFSDSGYFIKVFRKHFDTTPGDYRNGARTKASGVHCQL